MTLNDYTLGSIRERIKQEFGYTDSKMDLIIDSRINDAVLWIVRQRKNWPWLEAVANLFIKGQVTNLADVVYGSDTVSNIGLFNVNDPAFEIRDLVTIGALSNGIVKERPSEKELVLTERYLGATAQLVTITFKANAIKLPDDCISIETVYDKTTNEYYNYKSNFIFQQIVRDFNMVYPASNIYTVVNDPLGITKDRYINIYPHNITPKYLTIQYYKVPQKLELDTDVPCIPYEDRIVLSYVASWFISQLQRESNVDKTYYRELAYSELNKMLHQYKLADTANNSKGWVTPPYYVDAGSETIGEYF